MQSVPTYSASARAADCSAVSLLNAEIEALEIRVEKLRVRRQLITERLDADAHVYRVLTLPEEIVGEIFKQYIPAYPNGAPIAGEESPLRLARICRAWREVAMATRQLWRTPMVHLPGVDHKDRARVRALLDVLQEWIARSGTMTLAIWLHSPYARTPVELEDFLDAFNVMRAVSERWEYAHIRLPISPDGSIRLPKLQHQAPRLRELRVGGSSIEVQSLFFSAPAIERLSLNLRWSETLCPNVLDAADWHHLTALKLDDVLPHIAVQVLAQTPLLRHCWLTLWDRHAPEAEAEVPTTLCSPALESLIFDTTNRYSASRLFDALRLPRLQRLAILGEFPSVEAPQKWFRGRDCALKVLLLTRAHLEEYGSVSVAGTEVRYLEPYSYESFDGSWGMDWLDEYW
ncbi:MFS general substrate transporter [Mycena kentingensis (nom. inval.)]|nr:MFS general substrate transporter [Mycena kentingensis (nom. inval.)]